MTAIETMWISFAVNDDCGQATEGIRAADFGDWLSLECRTDNPTGFVKRNDKRITIGRRRFAYLGYQSWLGNMYWEGVKVTVETAQKIGEYLRKTGKYQPDSGVTEVWDAWESGAPIVFKDDE